MTTPEILTSQNGFSVESVKFEQTGRITVASFPDVDIFVAVARDRNLELFYLEDKFDDMCGGLGNGCANYSNFQEIQVDGGKTLLVSTRGIETATLENPFKMSQNSDAKYLAQRKTDSYTFLVQHLDGQTSHHLHPDKERFKCLTGNGYANVNLKVIKIEDEFVLEPGASHESFSLESPSISLIIQPTNTHHEHLSRSSLLDLREQGRLLD